jgi:glycine/D-amino acid oxidase-like deaminating enzyme
MAPKTTNGLPSEKWSSSFWHSEPSKILIGHRTTPSLPQQADVVIVGSGISGTSAAWHLLRGLNPAKANAQPISIVMLEAREACWGASGRNGGHCLPLVYKHPENPTIGHFEIKNLHALEALIQKLQIDCEFVTQPAVRGIYSEIDLEEAKISLAVLHETDPTLAAHTRLVTDATGLQALRVPSALGAIETDLAARMWPYKFVAHLLEQLVTSSKGSADGSFNLQTSTPVTSLCLADKMDMPTGGGTIWKLVTPRGTIMAKHIILATNAHTSFLVPEFEGLIVPCRGQMTALIPPPEASGSNRITRNYGFMGQGFYDYLIQRPAERGEHLMFGGGGKDEQNLGITDDSGIDTRAVTYLRERLYPFLGLDSNATSPPKLDAAFEWTGIMGFSRDDMPWVGPIPNYPGVFLAAGYTGHGMPNAFLCGQAVSVMLQSSIDGMDEQAAVRAAVSDPETVLPPAYVISQERIDRARKLDPLILQKKPAFGKVVPRL